MAHLNRPTEDRGQVILLIGFTLAVTFVALALILNSAIYAENLATRSDTGVSGGPIDLREQTRAGVSSLLEYVNEHNNTAKTAIASNLSAELEAYEGVVARQAAVNGRRLATSMAAITNGSRIVQPDAARNLSARNGSANWTVAKDVRARAMTVTVSDNRSSPGPCTPNGSCFRLKATNGSDVWRMAVYENSTDIVVEVETIDGTSDTYSPPPDGSTRVTIDLAAGTIDGRESPALRDGLPTPPYDIAIVHGDLATGTYEFVVDDPSLADSPDTDRFYGPGSTAAPRVTHAAYASTLRIEQHSDRIVYNGTVRVAPGEWP